MLISNFLVHGGRNSKGVTIYYLLFNSLLILLLKRTHSHSVRSWSSDSRKEVHYQEWETSADHRDFLFRALRGKCQSWRPGVCVCACVCVCVLSVTRTNSNWWLDTRVCVCVLCSRIQHYLPPGWGTEEWPRWYTVKKEI